MANNREILKHIARGVYATGVSGFDVDIWGYLERSEYDRRAVDACKSQVDSYEECTGETDRTSCFSKYLQEMKGKGYKIQ